MNNTQLVSENAKLLAENLALKKEVERLRALIPDEDPMEEDFVLTDDEEEVEEDTRPRICPLEIARVKKTLTQVWASDQVVCPCVDIDDKDRDKKTNKWEKKSFLEITTKELLGEHKWRYHDERQRRMYGEYFQLVPGVSQFRTHPKYRRKFHLNAKEKALGNKIMEKRRADPKILTTTDDIRARAKAEGYTITKHQAKTLQSWDVADWGCEGLMNSKIIYAYEYAIHYTKGGGMRVMSQNIHSASHTRYIGHKYKAEELKRGFEGGDYMQGNIILRKKK